MKAGQITQHAPQASKIEVPLPLRLQQKREYHIYRGASTKVVLLIVSSQRKAKGCLRDVSSRMSFATIFSGPVSKVRRQRIERVRY